MCVLLNEAWPGWSGLFTQIVKHVSIPRARRSPSLVFLGPVRLGLCFSPWLGPCAPRLQRVPDLDHQLELGGALVALCVASAVRRKAQVPFIMQLRAYGSGTPSASTRSVSEKVLVLRVMTASVPVLRRSFSLCLSRSLSLSLSIYIYIVRLLSSCSLPICCRIGDRLGFLIVLRARGGPVGPREHLCRRDPTVCFSLEIRPCRRSVGPILRNLGLPGGSGRVFIPV